MSIHLDKHENKNRISVCEIISVLVMSDLSSRARTRNTGRYVRSTPGSQSLERGLLLLRAFRHGVNVLTNAELAERTNLPRPTVSRLARSLVDSGFLTYDLQDSGYRLTAACLSLALSFRSSDRVLSSALPLMRELAEGRRVNVGLAVADRLEMVYLDSVRYSRLGIFRHIRSGTRIPIQLTSLGFAYLAGMRDDARNELLRELQAAFMDAWPEVSRNIAHAITSISKHGFCHANWQAGMAAVASPLVINGGGVYAVNVSFPFPSDGSATLVKEHAALLASLMKSLRNAVAAE